eukprot:gene14500-biopygen4278
MVPSLVGTPSLEFQESWDNVLESAQSQLLVLLVIQYRELLIGEKEKAFHHLTAVRASLTKEELAPVQEQLRIKWNQLYQKRRRKLISILARNGKEFREDNVGFLRTTEHHEHHIFDGNDLPPSKAPASVNEGSLSTDSAPLRIGVGEMNWLSEEGRITGRFVSTNVVNLSKKELSEDDVSLLSKGLKFCPTPKEIDKAELRADLEEFKRRMRLKWHFKDNNKTEKQLFKNRSNWQPPKNNLVLENYLSLVENEVLSVSPEGKNFSNLSPSELSSLDKLKCDKDIIIKEADKGSAVVVWDRGDYIMEANRQLDDRQVYEEVEVDPSVELGKTINDKLKEIREADPALDEVAGYLEVNNPRLGKLAGWLKDRGYEESLVNQQIDRVRRLDRETLLEKAGSRKTNEGRADRVPLVTTYHPALNGLGNIARKHHTLLTGSEEHKEVFPVPPVVAFRRCKNLKDILVDK